MMANVLDVVLETTKVLSLALVKKVVPTETKSQAETETRQAEATHKLKLKSKLRKFKLKPELGLQCLSQQCMLHPKKRRHNKLHLQRSKLLLPKLQIKTLTISFIMLREKNYPKKKS
jgi:hypothetical protein